MHQSRTSESGHSSEELPGLEPLSQFEESVRVRLESVISALPTPVGGFVHRLFLNEDSAGGRGLLQALHIASEVGWHPVGVWEDRAVIVESAAGEQCLMTVLAFSGFDASAGDPEDVARALDALRGSFAERRFMVAFRRPLPKGFDAEPLARAVSMWLVALERGEAHGPYAIYEDDSVSIELTLLQGPSGLGFMIPPCSSLERLAVIDRHVLATVGAYEHAPFPVIMVLANELGWNLPRGFVQQILYGVPEYVVSDSSDEKASYRALYEATGMSMFSIDQAKPLASLWWLEPSASDPLSCVAWATDNPWAPLLAKTVPFPGRRLARCDIQGGAAELEWTNYSKLEWGPE